MPIIIFRLTVHGGNLELTRQTSWLYNIASLAFHLAPPSRHIALAKGRLLTILQWNMPH